MEITEIIMSYLDLFFVISVILTRCIWSTISDRYEQIRAKLPLTFKIMLVVLYLTTIVSAGHKHEPQVYEELNEDMPEIVRRVRHSDSEQNVYQPPVFNYRTATQQDRMRSRYNRQQQVDFRHLKIAPMNPDQYFELNQYLAENSGEPINIGFDDSDWKPMQPNYVAPRNVKRPLEVVGKTRFAGIKHDKKVVQNDLDTAGSEPEEITVKETIDESAEKTSKTDRGDQNERFIYVQPNILKNNFGIDSKTMQETLNNSPPSASDANAEEFQISELQGLLGKNPQYQLQGLQKLLEDAKPVMQNLMQGHVPVDEGAAGIEVKSNGLPVNLSSNQPPIEDLQKQLDAVNKAHADAALAAAQKQAEAHVRAQHEAIALAQKQAEVEALAKIAAHNQGRTIINPNDHLQILDGMMPVTAAPLEAESPRPSPQDALIQQLEQNSLEIRNEKGEESAPSEHVEAHETSALNARPYEEVLLHQPHRESKDYASSYNDLRNSKPIIRTIPNPAPFTKVISGPSLSQPFAPSQEVYAPSGGQDYASPVIPEAPRLLHTHKFVPVPIKSTFLPTPPTVEEHRQDSYREVNIDTSHPIKNLLYSEAKHEDHDDVHQYAAKYAFGYRILDEKHGNDFGHEEKRDGKLTKGHYFVLLPDARRQKVDYFVDNSGYHAKVSYENVGRHPKYVTAHSKEASEAVIHN